MIEINFVYASKIENFFGILKKINVCLCVLRNLICVFWGLLHLVPFNFIFLTFINSAYECKYLEAVLQVDLEFYNQVHLYSTQPKNQSIADSHALVSRLAKSHDILTRRVNYKSQATLQDKPTKLRSNFFASGKFGAKCSDKIE